MRRISIGVVRNPLLILPSTVAPTLREEAEIAFLMRLIEVADLQKPIIFRLTTTLAFLGLFPMH
jgi:hypothetical protein